MSSSLPLMFLRPSCGPAYRPLSWLSRTRSTRMPLKAKITNPAFAAPTAKMSTIASITKEQPGDDPDDVIFNSLYNARTIELNRPKKLNSLNSSMARKIIARLAEWQKSQLAQLIIIGGAGPKAFCAGGDVAALAQLNKQGPEGQAQSRAYFGLEYQLDHMIATYQKPYVAYMDGITMGGGVGLSVHAPIRIATERTAFAMPETTIGLFPDVGGSFFLPRLDGAIGTYLALTSERLTGVNVFYAGIATHYVDSANLPNLTTRLAELQFKDYDDMYTRVNIVSATVSEYSSGLPPHERPLLSGGLRAAIDMTFGHSTMEQIISALETLANSDPALPPPSSNTADQDDDHQLQQQQTAQPTTTQSHPSLFTPSSWARATLQTLSTRSPTSLKCTLSSLRHGASWSIPETFQREHILAGNFMSHPDFTAGVTARLISKPATEPTWSPATLADVTDEEVDRMCTSLPPGGKRLELLNPAEGAWAYKSYPFAFGLPSEAEIGEAVREGGQGVKALVNRFERKRAESCGGDVGGVRGKVVDVLARRCRIVDGGRPGGEGEVVVEWVG